MPWRGKAFAIFSFWGFFATRAVIDHSQKCQYHHPPIRGAYLRGRSGELVALVHISACRVRGRTENVLAGSQAMVRFLQTAYLTWNNRKKKKVFFGSEALDLTCANGTLRMPNWGTHTKNYSPDVEGAINGRLFAFRKTSTSDNRVDRAGTASGNDNVSNETLFC